MSRDFPPDPSGSQTALLLNRRITEHKVYQDRTIPLGPKRTKEANTDLACSVGNMKILRRRATIVVAMLLSSILTVSARAAKPAEVFVYVQHYTPARFWFPVRFDGVVVAKIERGRFFVIDASPGRHMVSGKNGVPVFVDARPGKKVFVRLEWINGVLGGPALPAWEVADRATAHNDLLLLAYIDADKAISKSVPKTDPRKRPLLRHRRGRD